MSIPSWMTSELTYPGQPIASGQSGKMVKVVQEWLNLHDYGCSIDSSFGPATESQVAAFQAASGLSTSGSVEEKTFNALIAPMMQALTAPSLPAGATPNSAIVTVAQHHLKVHPLEVGGDNRGPWVRLYMKGSDGVDWKWCAGFACFIMDTAYTLCNEKMPLTTSFSVDDLVRQSKELHRFQSGQTPAPPPPGSLFFIRSGSNPNDWVHTGIVTGADTSSVATIEGNTNDDGSANGNEVAKRQRAYGKIDFFV